MNMDITLRQAQELVKCFGGDEDLVLTVVRSKSHPLCGGWTSHSGEGLYAHDEYPEHGYMFLGKGDK